MKYQILFDTLYKAKHQMEFDIRIEENTPSDGDDSCSSRIHSERVLQMRKQLKSLEIIIDAAFASIEETP